MKNSEPAWKKEIVKLEERGEHERVVAVLTSAALEGNVLAKIALAKKLWELQEYSEAHLEIEAAENSVDDNDFESNWQLHLAYTYGVGELDTIERWRRAFAHLKKAAEMSDDSRVLLAVAFHYRDGLNGVGVDILKAAMWFEKAAATGDPHATSLHRAFVKKNN